MALIHLRDTSRERAGIDDLPHGVVRRRLGRGRHGITEPEVVDDDVHADDAIASKRARRSRVQDLEHIGEPARARSSSDVPAAGVGKPGAPAGLTTAA